MSLWAKFAGLLRIIFDFSKNKDSLGVNPWHPKVLVETPKDANKIALFFSFMFGLIFKYFFQKKCPLPSVCVVVREGEGGFPPFRSVGRYLRTVIFVSTA